MAEKKKRQPDNTPKYKLERSKGGTKPIVKLVIPKGPISSLHDDIDGLLEQARKDGKNPTAVRGTLALY